MPTKSPIETTGNPNRKPLGPVSECLEKGMPGALLWLTQRFAEIEASATLEEAQARARQLPLAMKACIYYDDGTIVCGV